MGPGIVRASLCELSTESKAENIQSTWLPVHIYKNHEPRPQSEGTWGSVLQGQSSGLGLTGCITMSQGDLKIQIHGPTSRETDCVDLK